MDEGLGGGPVASCSDEDHVSAADHLEVAMATGQFRRSRFPRPTASGWS